MTTTVPQEKTIDTTDLDTTPSKVDSKVVIPFLSVKYLNVSEFIHSFLMCAFYCSLLEEPQLQATDAKGDRDEEEVHKEMPKLPEAKVCKT